MHLMIGRRMIVFEKRMRVPLVVSFLVPAASVLLALLLGAVVVRSAGVSPLFAFSQMIHGAVGDWYGISEVLVKMIPLALCALAVGVAFRMKFWNIGAEGQFMAGVIGATWMALSFDSRLGRVPLLLGMGVSAFLAGALLAMVPAVLKIFRGVSEVVVTLMLNYIVILFSEYLALSAWRDPNGYGFPGTREFLPVAWLTSYWDTRVHAGIILAVLVAIAVWVVVKYTRWGFELLVLGENPSAGRCSGMNVTRNILFSMIVSGGIAGLAGFSEVSGISHRLQKGMATGYGYTAIIVTWLARLGPMRMLFWSFFMAVLLVGGEQVQTSCGLQSSISLILEGAILLFLLMGDFFRNYGVRVVDRKDGGGNAAGS